MDGRGDGEGPAAAVEEDEWGRIAELFRWARDNGARGLEQVEFAYFEKAGLRVRGLAAAREVAGPILLPRSLLLLAPTEEELALRLALERQKTLHGQGSFWTPWIRTLPTPEEFAAFHLNYASPEVLAAFSALPVVAKVQACSAKLQERWGHAREEWLELTANSGVPQLTFSDIKWAFTMVQSRVYLPPPLYCFMPFADMMNTGPLPNMEVYDELELDSGEPSELYGIFLLPGCHVGPGEELIQCYVQADNAERLFKGGFLLQDNPVHVAALTADACQALQAPAFLESISAHMQPRIVASLQALAEEHLAETAAAAGGAAAAAAATATATAAAAG